MHALLLHDAVECGSLQTNPHDEQLLTSFLRSTVSHADVYGEPVQHGDVPGRDTDLQPLRLGGSSFVAHVRLDILMSDGVDNLVSNRFRGKRAEIAGSRRRTDRSHPAEAGAIPARRSGTRGHPRKHVEANRERAGQPYALCPVRDRRGVGSEGSRPRLQVIDGGPILPFDA